MNSKILSRFLDHTHCHQCGSLLEEAEVAFLFKSPVAAVVHIRCTHCGAEILANLGIGGCRATNVKTDLSSSEVGRFFNSSPVSADDVLDLHELVQKGTLWSVLEQEEEKFLERKPKSSVEKDSFPPSSLKEDNLPSPFS